MDADTLADFQDAMAEVDALSGTTFTVAGNPVQGNFTGADQSLELTVTGGQVEKVKGTLVLSRAVCPTEPALMSIITDAAKVRYRVAAIWTDDVAWTLTLTAPSGNQRR